MSSRDPAMSEGLRRVLARLDPRVRDVTNLTRLSAGATNDKLLDGGGPSVARASTPFVTLSWLTRF